MKLFTPTLFLFLSLRFVLISGQNPGLQVKITSSGLDLVKSVVEELVNRELEALELPDFSKENIRIYEQRAPIGLGRTDFSTRSPNVFTASVTDAHASLSARFSFRLHLFFFWHTFRGRASASASGIRISQDVFFTRESHTGKPAFTVGVCIASIGYFDIHLDAGLLGFILNLIIDLFEGTIKDQLEGRICIAINETLRSQAHTVTNGLNVHFPFVFNTNIDLGLTRNPVAGSNELTASLEGRCYRRSSPSESIPVSPPALPSVGSTSYMTRILISDYVLNTLFYAMYRDNRFRRTFSSSEINSLFGPALTEVGLSSIVPGLSSFANGSGGNLQAVVSAISAPRAEFNSSGITIYGPFSFVLNVIDANSSRVSTGLSLRLDVKVVAQLSASGNRITGRVMSLDVGASSDTHGFPVNDINTLLNGFIPSAVLPAINDVTSSGFMLPDFFNYKISRLLVGYQKHAVDVRVNFSHA